MANPFSSAWVLGSGLIGGHREFFVMGNPDSWFLFRASHLFWSLCAWQVRVSFFV